VKRRRHVGGRGGDVGTNEMQTLVDDHVATGELSLINRSLIEKCLPTDGKAAVVLVDAPCSSLGTLRRGPNVRWEVHADVLRMFPPVQKSLLEVGASFVRAGGVLVYATCTFHRAECDEVVEWFQQQCCSQDFEPLAFTASASETFTAKEVQAAVVGSEGAHMLRLLPHLHGTDGFFIARWKRRAGSELSSGAVVDGGSRGTTVDGGV
jgi:16S rRNA C967 or C1407 C5-methylase (RsmB/RsmF family)